MKTNIYKRLLSFFVAAVLLISAFSITAFAEIDAFGRYKWEISEDAGQITNGDMVYNRIELPVGYVFDPFLTQYYFRNEIEYTSDDGYEYNVRLYSYARDGELLNTEYTVFEYYEIFATAEGEQILNALVGGKYGKIRVEDAYWYHSDYSYGDLNTEVLDALISSEERSEGVEIDVKELRGIDCRYDIIVFDETDSLRHTLGAVYLVDGDYYFINYDKLSNEHFDADGNFSTRSGRVVMHEVGEDTVAKLEGALDAGYDYDCEYIYEEDDGEIDSPLPSGEERAILGFAIMLIQFGGILPAVILTLGLTRVKKTGKKYYFAIVGAAGAVLLISAVIAIILFI